ncbi:MAG: adenosylhomocysteinase [Candidatus Marinimicrobia bacterium]|jgi:adenosylhomocysteinase|nr:adenosylhomocysteinase [Candidatus Neomarinimicrobiota bacterium]MDP7528537.1 adenosylhomocysteinase [Candidatus Neomarinimicrobiota bacterium]
MSKITDKSLAEEGRRALGWAGENMPILASIRERYEEEKPLTGLSVGVAMHLEQKTGVLLQTLQAGGAEISASSCNPLTTDDAVAAALSEEMDIFAWSGQSKEEYYSCIESVIRSAPKITVDDGGDLIFMLHSKYPAMLEDVMGGCEETTTGVIRLKAMSQDGELKVPIIAVNNAYSKYLFDNRYGSGQSVIDAIASATNMLIAGKTVVVVGYGWVGRGVAMRLRGMGARVIVVETAASLNQQKQSGFHRGLEALYDGNWVMSMEEAAAMGDIFITATGNKHVISKHHFKKMKENVILANAGHFNNEIDVDSLQAMSKESKEIMPNLVRYRLKNGKGILLLSEGRLVNLARPSGHGHPIEIMDGSFAVQALCVEYLAKSSDSLKPEIYDVPSDLDEEVARLALAAQGITLQKPTPQQVEYVSAWEEGT